MNKISTNFIYSSILTISTYIFPLIVFPYVSRVLGVHNIGACNFIDSIIHYFILFSMMGMNVLGIREVAKSKGDIEKLSATFSSLLLLNLIFTSFALITLVLSINLVPKFHQYKEMLYIGAAKLIFNSLLIEWFYKGIEDFKYITIRTLVIKCIYVVSIFCLIRSESDYIRYFSLNVLMVVINAIVNIFHAKTKVILKPANCSTIGKYLKPFIILGVYQLLTSMYTTFNVAYLGFECGDLEVGNYTTATKLYGVILGLFSAFTGVMLPRMSSLISEGKVEDLVKYIGKSVDILFMFAMPMITISIVYAPQIIGILAGKGYSGAILPMRIIMPLMLVIGYEQILVLQILTPLGKDKAILMNSIVGAIVGIILNLILVPIYASIGSSIVWFISELMVLISAQLFVSNYISIKFPFQKLIKNILFSIPILLFIFFLKNHIENNLLSLGVGTVIALLYYSMVYGKFYRNATMDMILSRIYNKNNKR